MAPAVHFPIQIKVQSDFPSSPGPSDPSYECSSPLYPLLSPSRWIVSYTFSTSRAIHGLLSFLFSTFYSHRVLS